MAKLSVYVPDDLWDGARAVAPTSSPSQLVQDGLRRLVGSDRGVPGYSRRPAGVDRRLAEVQARLTSEASKEYEIGYRCAVEVAAVVPLPVLNQLVDVGFDLARWLRPLAAGVRDGLVQTGERITPEEARDSLLRINDAREPHDDAMRREDPDWWIWKTAEGLGDLADPIGFDGYAFHPTLPRQRGFADAMREVWELLDLPSAQSDAASGLDLDPRSDDGPANTNEAGG